MSRTARVGKGLARDPEAVRVEAPAPDGSSGAGAGPSNGQPRRRWGDVIDNPRVRRVVYVGAGALVFYWILQWLWPAPTGVLVQGLIIGALTALISFGLALVYRANRVINFAQADLGAIPAVLAVCLMNFRPAGALTRYGRTGQFTGVGTGLPYWLAVPIALLAAVALGALVEWLLVRRFRKAPRLILMVVTIGLAQILAGLGTALPLLFGFTIPPQRFPSPFDFSFGIHPLVFRGNDLLAVVAVVGVSLALFGLLRFTNIGVAIRACAENADRASLLGISVGRIQSVVWIVATVLATIATFLRAGTLGLPIGSAFGPTILVRALAAAVIGRMENYGVMFSAAAGLGIIEASVLWNTRSTNLVDPVLFVVVLGTLLLQRRRRESRVEDQAISTWQEASVVRPIPRELAGLPEVRWGLRALGGLLAAGLVGLPWVLGPARSNLAAAMFIYAIIAVSLVMLTGWAGEISLGQVAFFGIGAAVSGGLTVHYHLDLTVTVLIAAVVGAASAFLIGLPALRIRGLFLAVSTLAFALATSSYLLNRQYVRYLPDNLTQPVERLPLFGRVDISGEHAFYYVCLAVLGMVLWAARGLQRSRMARVLIAARENERAAQAFGVNLTRARLTAFAFAGFFASLAGGLFAIHQRAVGEQVFAPVESIRVMTMVVVGGLGSIPGALLGTVFVKSTEWFSALVPRGYRSLFTFAGSGIGLIFVLLMVRGGLGAVLYRIRDRLLRVVAKRRRIVVPSLVADIARAPGPGLDLAPALVDEVGLGPSVVVAPIGDGSGSRRRAPAAHDKRQES